MTSGSNAIFSHHQLPNINILSHLCSAFQILRLPPDPASQQFPFIYTPAVMCPRKASPANIIFQSPYVVNMCVSSVCVKNEQSMDFLVRKSLILILGMSLSTKK